jgi:hypothetical protein
MELSEIVAAALAEDVGTGLVEENPGARCRRRRHGWCRRWLRWYHRDRHPDGQTGNAGVTVVPWTAELALRVLGVTVETPNAEIIRRAREASARGTFSARAVQALRAVGYDV